ncbi:MAG: hypothetical protein M0Z78_05360 [Betaproteobacteria bacterium]|jgi:hypothetical protein|nr:hypothetical protein [Betaproteobacteria bacterium]
MKTADTTASTVSTSPKFFTIEQAAKARPAFSPAALRDLKFKAHDRRNSRGDVIKGNGTGPAGVWLQVGRKVLMDLERFDAWLDSHRAGAAK